MIPRDGLDMRGIRRSVMAELLCRPTPVGPIMSNLQLAVHFFFQLAMILIVCQLVGRAARPLGQPQVVAEMIAGVLLGPSLLGLFWPGAFARLFPVETLSVLYPISQLGIAAYMFVVGMEFRVDIVQRRLRSAVAVSITGMATPFILGAALGWFFFHHTSMFPAKTSLAEAMIFLGASMCITAFPMLARIIHFKKLAGTTMGTVALGAGAIDDAAAWCLLAVVLASFTGEFSHAVINIGGGILYVGVTLLIVRPLLSRWSTPIELRGYLNDRDFVFCLILVMLGAWFTDAIGLHAVFGAFVMGAAMPRGVVTSALMDRIQPLTVALLLPLFFTYSGLNTQIGLLDSTYLWFMALLVLVVAVGGKGVACWLAARATGISNREALGIGTLMNARGLMELIIINIGLQRGIISPALFATLAIMAVVTTLMASPLFEWLVGRHGVLAEPEEEPLAIN
ncbi:MAG: cation:proton antiporter [Opitutaceae bacterium]|nr:cation:proton antiporter [Opitutaceae bacterium]